MKGIIAVLFIFFAVSYGALSCAHDRNNTVSANGSKFTTNGGVITTIPTFTIFNNAWGLLDKITTFRQTIFTCVGGGFGWSWNRGMSSFIWNPNYPEVSFGLSPLYVGGASTTNKLPQRLSKIPFLEAEMDIDFEITDNSGKNMWNLAYDIWLSTYNASAVDTSKNITVSSDEIMIWFHWNTQNTKVNYESNAVNDGYNVYDLAETSINADTGVRYYMFRITGAMRVPEKVNLVAFFNYAKSEFGRGDVFLSSIELGSENWDNTTGTVIIRKLNYNFVAPTTTGTSTTASTTSSPTTSTTASNPNPSPSPSSTSNNPSSSTTSESQSSSGFSLSPTFCFTIYFCVLIVALL